MKLLFVTNLYPPHWFGGYEQLADWVARGLRARGHEVLVLTGRGPGFEDQPEILQQLDLDVLELLAVYRGDDSFRRSLVERVSRHLFSWANWRSCRRVVRRHRPDLVCFWNLAHLSLSPLWACRFEGTHSLVHLSDTHPHPFQRASAPNLFPFTRSFSSGVAELLLREARPQAWVVPSQFLARKLVADLGLSESRMRICPWPIPPDLAPPSTWPDRATATRLLSVGALVPEKGPQVLIQAFRAAFEQQPDLTLTMVGEGPELFVARLREAATDLPVRFLGRRERAEMGSLYSRHDVLVLPSVWDEPYSLVPLEAMAHGLAVVATRTGGTPEAVEDGVTGRLVPAESPDQLAAALLSLARDPRTASELARRGREWAKAHGDFDRFLDRIEELYREAEGGSQEC